MRRLRDTLYDTTADAISGQVIRMWLTYLSPRSAVKWAVRVQVYAQIYRV